MSDQKGPERDAAWGIGFRDWWAEIEKAEPTRLAIGLAAWGFSNRVIDTLRAEHERRLTALESEKDAEINRLSTVLKIAERNVHNLSQECVERQQNEQAMYEELAERGEKIERLEKETLEWSELRYAAAKVVEKQEELDKAEKERATVSSPPVAAPKGCPECGHPFHAGGGCRGVQAEPDAPDVLYRCRCKRNMVVKLGSAVKQEVPTLKAGATLEELLRADIRVAQRDLGQANEKLRTAQRLLDAVLAENSGLRRLLEAANELHGAAVNYTSASSFIGLKAQDYSMARKKFDAQFPGTLG